MSKTKTRATVAQATTAGVPDYWEWCSFIHFGAWGEGLSDGEYRGVQLVALYMAACGQKGRNIYPMVATIAKRLRYSDRMAKHLRSLAIHAGLFVPDRWPDGSDRHHNGIPMLLIAIPEVAQGQLAAPLRGGISPPYTEADTASIQIEAKGQYPAPSNGLGSLDPDTTRGATDFPSESPCELCRGTGWHPACPTMRCPKCRVRAVA